MPPCTQHTNTTAAEQCFEGIANTGSALAGWALFFTFVMLIGALVLCSVFLYYEQKYYTH